MMKSMTGYARSEKREGQIEASVEIRSYNSRYLDVTLKISHDYYPLEDQIKRLISGSVSRGRIEIAVTIRDRSDKSSLFEVDREKAVSLKHALVQLKEMLDFDDPIPFSLIAGTNGVVKAGAGGDNSERCWEVLKSCLETALTDLDGMRIAEGTAMAGDFNHRLGLLEGFLMEIGTEQEEGIGEYREKLTERIKNLLQNLDVDPARIAQEVAILADKRDISEEIFRAKSHLAQFRTIMDSKEPAGRKLNFLLQELNREFNTIGAKAEKARISHVVVEAKSELEKMREQVLNLE
ncbi:MAG: YicC/YloC family endoribonuclease [Thermodesulfobacteriota bacterium]